MKQLFAYNWQVRAEWLDWCRALSEEELLRERTGGVGSILQTLFHIIDVECSWIQTLANEPVEDPLFNDYMSLERIVDLNIKCHAAVARYVNNWSSSMENETRISQWETESVSYTCGEVMRHVIAHEIHHIGQLSIWAREMDLKPVSANYIGRSL